MPVEWPEFRSLPCPVCRERRVHYAFSVEGTRVLACSDCGFTFRAQPSQSLVQPLPAFRAFVERMGGEQALLQKLWSKTDPFEQVRCVDWSGPESRFLPTATALGGDSPDAGKGDGGRAVNLSVGQLDGLNDPVASLRGLRSALLARGESIAMVFSDMRHAGGLSAASVASGQMAGQEAYLDTQAVLTLLFLTGFRVRRVCHLHARVSLEEVNADGGRFFQADRWALLAAHVLPAAIRRTVTTTARLIDTVVIAEPRKTERPVVSVVVPVFNEAATVAAVLDAVLCVSFAEADVEVIIVESNSTDGSRDIVQRYADHPRVTCVFEEGPRGKGHATRQGIARASGDILIIQDADLEYDIEDYHSLIEPILRGHESFVLGSRHGGKSHWKLRQFTKPLLALFYNVGHVLFTGYINLLFGLRLYDPQTMYKVVRRDCIEGLLFRGNYFDFDHELLIKVVRKGYRPVEVPVNYRSRSHAEGKKIRMWRDGPLCLWMITRMWLAPLRSFFPEGDTLD